MPAQYWGLTPETNAIRLTTGPGAAAMTSVVAGYQAAGVTHMQQGAQMMATAATTASIDTNESIIHTGVRDAVTNLFFERGKYILSKSPIGMLTTYAMTAPIISGAENLFPRKVIEVSISS